MITNLPGARELFEKFLLPWCGGEKKPPGLRPESYTEKRATSKPLRADYEGLLKDHLLETLPKAARYAYLPIIAFSRFNGHVLATVNAYFDEQRIATLVSQSDPADFANGYLTAVSHYAAMLSSLFLQNEGFEWRYEHPYFRSVVVHAPTRTVIPVFDWAVRQMSAEHSVYGIHAAYENIMRKIGVKLSIIM